ncbi:MAG: small subunit ribosomal protein [Thermoleophilaceae bacterium]|nr:small subunit ribosomal protein [Thermoleophilaceae bacterium]
MFDEERDPDAGTPEDDAPEAVPGPEIEGAEQLSAASGEEPEAPAEEPVAEEPVTEEPEAPAEAAEAAPDAADAPDAPESAEAPRDRRPKPEAGDDKPEEEVIPGMHLEPDLVLEEQAREDNEFGKYAEAETATGDEETGEEGAEDASAEGEPVAHTPLDLAADARYAATGKRKSAVARVILRPGEGTYSVNGRHLDEYFPRVKLQRVARQPLEAAGYNTRLDVVARIHGGGTSAQATALRHGIARALVEADPALRSELKRRGYLTRDPRVKERKKAGLKKARKRPQFSKR